MLVKAVLTAAVVLAAASWPGFATAQDAPKDKSAAGCEQFSWSVTRERAWFKDSKLARRASGVRLRKIDRAVDLALEPTNNPEFFLPPERKPQPHSFSG